MTWSQEKTNQMIKELEEMGESLRKDLDKLTEACNRLVEETKDIPSIEEQIKKIIKLQGEQFNE
jgi:hypothetical protein